MSRNYAKELPLDSMGNPIQESPAPFKADARFYRDNGATSSIQTLAANTTQIEVGAGGATGAWIRWLPASEGAAAPAGSVLSNNFDHYIPEGGVRRFVVPKESMSVSSVVGLRAREGLYARFAVANVGTGSVLTTEY